MHFFKHTGADKSLLRAAQQNLPLVGFAALKKALKQRDIKVNGVRVSKNVVLKNEDEVQLFLPNQAQTQLKIMFEDHNVLVIDKPKRLSCDERLLQLLSAQTGLPILHEAEVELHKDEVAKVEQHKKVEVLKTAAEEVEPHKRAEFLKAAAEEVEPHKRAEFLKAAAEEVEPHKRAESCLIGLAAVHRLDTNTEGLLMFAKNEAAEQALLQGFKSGQIHKKYHAWVAGSPGFDSQMLTAYLKKDASNSKVIVLDTPQKGAKTIRTAYKVLQREQERTLLEVQIFTGRTHQIRAHLSHIGLPILGDDKYGNFTANKKFGLKYQQLRAVELSFSFPSQSLLFYLNKVSLSLV